MNTTRYSTLAAVLAAGFLTSFVAKGETLTTAFTGGNSNDGIMFDVLAAENIWIHGFQVGLTNTTQGSVQLFSKAGTHVGFEADQTAWTDFGSQALSSSVANGPSQFYHIAEPILMKAAQRRALYIVEDPLAGPFVAYTNGDGVGSLEASNAHLSIFEGKGVSGNFGSLNNNRIPNVTIYYTLATIARPEVTLLGGKQVKSKKKSVVVTGVAASELGVKSVRIQYKVLQKNGKKKIVTRTVVPDKFGIFRRSIPVIPGRNRVTVTVIDTLDQTSKKAIKIIVGP